MATNTFTQVSGALTSTAANWSGGLPTGVVDALVFGANATLDSNISGASVDIAGYTIVATVAHTITAVTVTDGAGTGTIQGATNQLITITGAFTPNGTTFSFLSVGGSIIGTASGTANKVTAASLQFTDSGSTGTNFTISGTTLMGATGSLTGTFGGLVTTADPAVANVTGTLSRGLAYTPDAGTTKYYNQAYINGQGALKPRLVPVPFVF